MVRPYRGAMPTGPLAPGSLVSSAGIGAQAYFLVEKVAKKHFPEGNSPFGGRSAPIKGPPVKSRDGFYLFDYGPKGPWLGLQPAL